MDAEQAKAWFVAALRRVLQDLYDPRALRASPLVAVFDLTGDVVPALRRIIFDAIHALQPGEDVPPHAQAWRIHQILTYRYLEQSSQASVAGNLGLSIRQLRRQERVAESILADALWSIHPLAEQAIRVAAAQAAAYPEAGPSGQGRDMDRASELAWLQRSVPNETVYLAAVIESAQRTVAPLARQLDVTVTADVQPGLPPVVGQESLLRQALLSLLTAAAHAAPGGQVQITAALADADLCLAVRAQAAGPDRRAEGTVEVAENLHMAHELAGLTRGQLRVEEEGRGFAAQLALPPAERIPVLAVDDNVDTLKLYERYLSISPYRLVGTPDPRQALALAEQLDPAAILLDVMLPGIDGWELLGRLREHPLTAGVPVIVCTILPQEQLALALGAAAFIRKPVAQEALLAALGQWAGEGGLPDEADLPARGSP